MCRCMLQTVQHENAARSESDGADGYSREIPERLRALALASKAAAWIDS